MLLQYRDVAPETVDDTALRNLIKKHQGSRDGIAGALENIWRGNIVFFVAFWCMVASSMYCNFVVSPLSTLDLSFMSFNLLRFART